MRQKTGQIQKTEKARRRAGLRRILENHRRELQSDIETRLRRVRADHEGNGGDEFDVADVATRRDLDQALLQIRAETLVRIDEALVRFDDGEYGSCVACEGEIADHRLRVLPFAIRCRACEEAREENSGRARSVASRIGTPPGHRPDMLGS